MSLGLDPAVDTALPPVGPARGGRLSTAIELIRHPGAALRRVAERPGRPWLWPLVVLAVLAAAVGALQARTAVSSAMSGAASSEATMAQPASGPGTVVVGPGDAAGADIPPAAVTTAATIGVVLGVVFAVIAVFGGAAIGAAILHFLSTVFGGQETYTQMLTVFSWSRVPVIFGALLQLVYGLAARFDPNPAGLSGLMEKTSLAYPVLAEIELWNLWALALLFVGLRGVSRLSVAKAAIAVGALVFLRVLLGEASVLAARFMSGI